MQEGGALRSLEEIVFGIKLIQIVQQNGRITGRYLRKVIANTDRALILPDGVNRGIKDNIIMILYLGIPPALSW